MLDSEGRVLADFEIQVAGVRAKGRGVNGGEVDGALVLNGEGFESVGEGGAFFWCFGEDVGEGDAGLRDGVSFGPFDAFMTAQERAFEAKIREIALTAIYPA